MFQPQGNAPHLHWLCQRLQARGLLRATADALPAWLPAEWQGFAGEHCWLDLASDDSDGLMQRSQLCRQHQTDCIEICGQWLPQGAQFGFMLLCGGERTALQRAAPWLDCNAPLDGGWLHCGPLGSARYTWHVLNAIQHGWQLLLQQIPVDGQPVAINWEWLLQQQNQLCDMLYQLSSHYLQRQGIDPKLISPDAARSNFALPCGEQAHFAANLAILIVLALQQQETLHTLLQQLSATLPTLNP